MIVTRMISPTKRFFSSAVSATAGESHEQASLSKKSRVDDDTYEAAAISSWLNELKEPFYAYRPSTTSSTNLDSPQAFSMERLSSRPPIFLLRNFLSGRECKSIQNQEDMEHAQTLNGQGSTARPNCKVSWVDTWDDVAQDVATFCFDDSFERDHGGMWVEKLQVLRYSREGKYVLHHDGHDRLLTCLYYLNGVGGTWFPLANSSCSPTTREEALYLSERCVPGRDGLLLTDDTTIEQTSNVVHVQAGDAVVFYNYQMNPYERGAGAVPDWKSLHAGLPTRSEEKWIANHWFHIVNE